MSDKVTMKGYKAFDKGMVCRGKQYAENTVFEEETAEVCQSGMHFCKEPLEVLNYYPLVNRNGEMSEFAEVEALDEPKTDDNKKYCTKKLKVKGKISFAKLVQASVSFEWGKSDKTIAENDNGGYSAKIGSSGDSAQIGSSGDYAKIGSSGYYAVIMCAGQGSIAKAKKGSWITLSEWKFENNLNRNIPVCVKTVQVDGKTIKEDTFYKLENGEFVEVE